MRGSRQPIFPLIHASVREAWLDLDRFAGDVAELGESGLERLEERFVRIAGCRTKVTDASHSLLRPRPERPRGQRARVGNEIAPPHSITSSAAASNEGGTARPSAFAALR